MQLADILLVSFFGALLLAVLFTPVAIKIAPKIGAMDIPKDERRMHSKPMPRFGGLGIFIGMAIAILVCVPKMEGVHGDRQVLGFLAGGAMIVVLGIIDDLKGLSAKVKLVGQIVCAIVPCLFSVRIFAISNIFKGGAIVFPEWFSIIVTVLWIVGITNTINLTRTGHLPIGIITTIVSRICIMSQPNWIIILNPNFF